MSNFKIPEKVTNALTHLIEAISEDHKVSVRTRPTQDLLDNMQYILDELKRRYSFETTKKLQQLPIGSKVIDKNSTYYDAPVIWLVVDHNFYDNNLTTLVSERILTFKAFDAAEPDNPDELRSEYGNNDYKVSNIHQWLNSDLYDWFKPLHQYDQAPTSDFIYHRPYVDEPGFLNKFSNSFKNSMVETRFKDFQAKVFLLSDSEIGFSEKDKALELFKNEAYRGAKPTKECVLYDEEGSADETDWWWLRTPHAGYSYSVRYVYASGAPYSGSAFLGYLGVRPALNFPSEIRVKAEPDANGIYEIVWS